MRDKVVRTAAGPAHDIYPMTFHMADGADEMPRRDKEEIGRRLDEAVSRFGGGEAVNLRSGKRDRVATRMLPYLVVACVIATVALTVARGDFEFWKFINQLCVVFALAFAAVGTWASFYMDRGPFPLWLMAGMTVVALVVAWVFITGSYAVLFLKGLDSYKSMEPGTYTEALRIADLLFTLFVMVMAPIGILTTVSAMLRKYIPGVLMSVEKGGKNGKNPAAKFFKVPDIIDVERVELAPEEDEHAVDLPALAWMTGYTFGLGTLVCSMLFLNPVVLETVPEYLIIRVMIVLSLFLPAMVVPWLCIKSIGARVVSGAPRPYYLWVGARQQLFTGFATLSLFFFSFLISVYYGNEVQTIARYYIEYLIPLGAISLVMGMFYSNCFSRSLRDAICREFASLRGGGRSRGPPPSLRRHVHGPYRRPTIRPPSRLGRSPARGPSRGRPRPGTSSAKAL